MPLYEYVCERCGEKQEALRRVSARDEPAECPECDGRAERALSAFAVGAGGGGYASAPSSSAASCFSGG